MDVCSHSCSLLCKTHIAHETKSVQATVPNVHNITPCIF